MLFLNREDRNDGVKLSSISECDLCLKNCLFKNTVHFVLLLLLFFLFFVIFKTEKDPAASSKHISADQEYTITEIRHVQ